MLEQRFASDPTGKSVIPYLHHEPRDPARTIFFFPGFGTRGDYYRPLLTPLTDHRIIIPEFHVGSHPVRHIDGLRNTFMTLYRYLSRTYDIDDHVLAGYSAGGYTALRCAADIATDHTLPHHTIAIAPAMPGLGLHLHNYAIRFFTMGTKLQFGKEGKSGSDFALHRGAQFIMRALWNYTATRDLLSSIDHAEMLPIPPTVPLTTILQEDDEFFDPAYSTDIIRRYAPHARIITQPGTHARILHDPSMAATEILRAV